MQLRLTQITSILFLPREIRSVPQSPGAWLSFVRGKSFCAKKQSQFIIVNGSLLSIQALDEARSWPCVCCVKSATARVGQRIA